jgi:putative thiamine transport system permease protein
LNPHGSIITARVKVIRFSKSIGALPLVILFALPLIASFVFALSGLFDAEAWSALLQHPQLWPALQLSVFTGLASAALALLLAVIIIAGLYDSVWWSRLSPQIGAMLAVPHVAMAIGLSFLIMPSGFLARLVAFFAGWNTPPNWISNHDPYGLSLIAALVIKETPFLTWIIASILNREDVRRSFTGQRAAATSLGHGTGSIWMRIFLPQILSKLAWPLLVVFVYAATVVDMALVIGPTQPPTFASIVWADINDAQVLNNARGGVGALFLSFTIAVTALIAWGVIKFASAQRGWMTRGPSAWRIPALIAKLKFTSLIVIYFAIAATMMILSFATLWPFPYLWPAILSAIAWERVWDNPSALVASLVLAFSTSVVALALVIGWMESQPQARDKYLLVLSATALGLPAILLGLGQYRAFLQTGLTGTAVGLFLAHLMPVTAYMFIVLAGPYRSFDPRWRASASGLLAGFPRFFLAIKIPLLKAPLLAASAIGFAVSFGQYVPAQLIAAGRYSTLPMEAVTLTSGTNRPLTAAFTLLLMLPPLIAFIAAAYFSKPRWSVA